MSDEDNTAIRNAIQFLGWVADSYETHAKTSADHPEEYDAYMGSAEMARDHAKALSFITAPPNPEFNKAMNR